MAALSGGIHLPARCPLSLWWEGMKYAPDLTGKRLKDKGKVGKLTALGGSVHPQSDGPWVMWWREDVVH